MVTSTLTWTAGAFCVISLLSYIIDRRRAAVRRAMCDERRLWWEYRVMAARSAEELTGARR